MRRSNCLWQKFREAFSFPTKDVAHFYPGHMDRGMTRMQRTLRSVDLVVEVHDARIPFSGRNANFTKTITVRPHLLVLNKMDLAESRYFEKVRKTLREEHGIQHVIYTNCKKGDHRTIKKKLMNTMVEILDASPRYHRSGLDEYSVLVIGVPNVGKSTMINSLRNTHMRKRKALPVGPHAGVTTSVMEKVKISENPRIFLYDSPGITTPDVPEMNVAMKLALCATLKDSLIGQETITDYMLYWLNRHGHFSYVDALDLPGPTDNIVELLSHVARKHDLIQKQRISQEIIYKPNFHQAARIVLRTFREGKFGRFTLDEDFLRQPAPQSSLLDNQQDIHGNRL